MATTSESILQKRIKRFKSIKRGYYSLLLIFFLYGISLIGPLWINNKPLILKYDSEYYFPAIVDLFDFMPWVNYPLYEAKKFNQKSNRIEVDFRKLKKQIEKNDSNDFILMPIYPYHPHEDLKDKLDEIYEDLNNNGKYDNGEIFIDQNNDGVWTENNPPTKPDGFGGRHLLGTDNTGRDLFARVIDGFKVSITFAVT